MTGLEIVSVLGPILFLLYNNNNNNNNLLTYFAQESTFLFSPAHYNLITNKQTNE